jgi:hypothetical protein
MVCVYVCVAGLGCVCSGQGLLTLPFCILTCCSVGPFSKTPLWHCGPQCLLAWHLKRLFGLLRKRPLLLAAACVHATTAAATGGGFAPGLCAVPSAAACQSHRVLQERLLGPCQAGVDTPRCMALGICCLWADTSGGSAVAHTHCVVVQASENASGCMRVHRANGWVCVCSSARGGRPAWLALLRVLGAAWA